MKKLYCITCPVGCELTIIGSGYDMVVDGNKCKKGYEFAEHEMSNPTRTLTTTVRTKFPGIPVISVRTAGEIPKSRLMEAMLELSKVVIEEEMDVGDTVLEDIADTGVSVIITSGVLMKLGAELENKNVELEKFSSGGGGSAAMTSGDGTGRGGSKGGTAGVRNITVLDDMGMESAGGFVGAAGEAVGVEGAEDEDGASEDDIEGYIKPKSRPHIKRR